MDLLRGAIERFGSRLAITTSLISPGIRVVTLDTGRLPAMTYEMVGTVRRRYGVRVELVSPDADEIEAMVTRHGPNLFYESIALRSLCCHFRKVRPLERKLESFDAWVVGLRRSQTEARGDLEKVQDVNGKLKISPLADWTAEQVRSYIAENDVPEHPLYAKGYTSIGCEPCTRATLTGEAERAGRWWWEDAADKECGLHFTPDGRVERTLDVLVRDILTPQHA
jgi:phosphoadenylyl-sulfate reductase (thioredoxin)